MLASIALAGGVCGREAVAVDADLRAGAQGVEIAEEVEARGRVAAALRAERARARVGTGRRARGGRKMRACRAAAVSMLLMMTPAGAGGTIYIILHDIRIAGQRRARGARAIRILLPDLLIVLIRIGRQTVIRMRRAGGRRTQMRINPG